MHSNHDLHDLRNKLKDAYMANNPITDHETARVLLLLVNIIDQQQVEIERLQEAQRQD